MKRRQDASGRVPAAEALQLEATGPASGPSLDVRRDMGRVIILTGGRGVGKTTVCRKAVALADQEGYACAGILTLVHHGVREVLDVRNGRRRRLTTASDEGRAVSQGRFRFSPRTLSWGQTLLSQATPCDLLVIDEVGPLELVRGEGWVNAFDVLRAGTYALALLVVRPELIAQARGRLAPRALEVLTVTRENRDALPDRLLERLVLQSRLPGQAP